MMTNLNRWTYNRNMGAQWGSFVVTVPDQVADNQREFDLTRRTFPARTTAGVLRFRLAGDLYGLHSPGTGDMVVVRA